MAQATWNLRGAATNEYIVEPRHLKDIYVQSEWAMMWGKLNGNRSVTPIMHGDTKLNVAIGGNESVVWEQDFGTTTGEARYSYEDPMSGTRTYGTHDVKPGDYPSFKHEVIYAVQNDSPAIPLMDKESQMRQSNIIPFGQLLPHTKNKMKLWREKMTEIDGFSALLNGASDGLLDTTDGGMGITLAGCSAGQTRSPYNVIAAAGTALVTPNYTRATHENAVSDAIRACASETSAANAFDFEQHKRNSDLISELRIAPVTVGGISYRAIAIADPDAISRLVDYAGTYSNLLRLATPRSEKNKALDGMQTIELDNILYVTNRYLKYFRPTVTDLSSTADTVTWMTPGTDPFAPGFVNTSKYVLVMYLGAGAILRGRRKEMWFSLSGEGASDEGHKKGTTVAMHYYDAWKRKEWVTKDGTSSIKNDSMLLWVGSDAGIGVAMT